jgi:TolB protein
VTASLTARVAVARRDDSVVVLNPGDSNPGVLTAHGRWPCWRPGGRYLAVSRVDRGTEAAGSSIVLFDTSGRELQTVFRSPPGVSPAIAPRVPHYLSWSPNGTTLSYVAMGHGGLTLYHKLLPGDEPAREVAVGAPLFSAWSPASRFQAIHAGSTMLVADAANFGSPPVLSDNAVGFRAPAYSSDGTTLAYAARAGEGLDLLFAAPNGEGPRRVAHFSSGLVMAFRPGSTELSVASASDPAGGVFDALWFITEGGDRRRAYRGPFVTFSWSPDASRLAIVVPTQTGDGRYAVHALSPGGEFLAATEPVIPSEDLRMVFGFFDQYLQSHRLWAPDGSGLLLAGRLPVDGVSASFGDPLGPYVWLWPAERGTALQCLCPGSSAFFASNTGDLAPE